MLTVFCPICRSKFLKASGQETAVDKFSEEAGVPMKEMTLPHKCIFYNSPGFKITIRLRMWLLGPMLSFFYVHNFHNFIA
jgi:hypothetical protein